MISSRLAWWRWLEKKMGVYGILPSRGMATLVTPRDLQIFQALDRGPLTLEQLFKINQTFTQPFTGKHRLWERLQILTASGRVRRYTYATEGPGALRYYTLSPVGYQLL